MRPEAGQRFAHFHVYSVLGRGGMGVVFSAYNTRDRRAVALKLLTVDLAADPSSRERFQRESRLARSLQSPYAISVLDAGESDGELWLEMPLLPGEDLHDLLRREGPQSPDTALGIAGQVAAGLDAAHGIGLIHRDVKPANVRLVASPIGRGPRAFLGDFGLTRPVGPVDAGLTHVGEIVGTGQYMAPEQVQQQPLDRRADVYSLACLLYACLAGEPPFPGRDARQVMAAQVHQPPPPLLGRGLAVGPRLQGAVFAGLAKQAAQRPPSAGSLIASCTAAADADRPRPLRTMGPSS